MYTITYEEYHNDYTRNERLTKTFQTIDGLAHWIKTTTDSLKSVWPSRCYETGKSEDATRIEFKQPGFYYTVWIHQIENERGIIFSDGAYTGSQRHYGEAAKPVMEAIAQIRKTEYNFV